MSNIFETYLEKKTSSSSLSIFRFFFGLLMCVSILRFWSKGWIEELYINPTFHFSYYGFEWVKPLGDYTYFIFLLAGICSFFVCIGFKYRVSIILFFLSFLYIELMDKTTYLNHYYFINCISFILIFLPANASFSIDNLISKKTYTNVPKWTVDSLKIFIALVYVYAGIAKINSDWLLHAMPLGIWLSSKYHFPLLGELFQEKSIHYLMSWGGLLYDLFIPFLLLYRKTRITAFILVVIFHLMTKILFPIGMFPYIMIFSSIIFFTPSTHDKMIRYFFTFFKKLMMLFSFDTSIVVKNINFKFQNLSLVIIMGFLIIQSIVPFRYLLYPGELLWHEQGYRFSWRVMLVEKTGIANFKIVNPLDNSFFYVENSRFLTPFQEKQMSFQPDFILEYAHHLGDYYSDVNDGEVKVFVENYVALNSRKSQMLVSDTVNLYKQKNSLRNKEWIIPLTNDIQGF